MFALLRPVIPATRNVRLAGRVGRCRQACPADPCSPVTQGQIRFVNASDYVVALEGLIAAEGYHAGAVRELLIEQAGGVVTPYGLSLNQIAQVRLLQILHCLQTSRCSIAGSPGTGTLFSQSSQSQA